MKLKKMFSFVIAMVFTLSCVTYANALNIDIYIDNSFMGKNGNSGYTTRISQLTSNIRGMYGGGFGIDISFNFSPINNRIVDNPAEDCPSIGGYTYPRSTNYCQCYTNSQCVSSSSTRHHTNYYTMRSTVLGSTSPNSAELLFTVHNICGTVNNSHSYCNGITWKSYRQIISRDYNLLDSDGNTYTKARATVAHEIGHLYNVSDHYNVSYGDSRDDCIWGYNYYSESVYKTMKVCNTCYQTLKANKGIYDTIGG